MHLNEIHMQLFNDAQRVNDGADRSLELHMRKTLSPSMGFDLLSRQQRDASGVAGRITEIGDSMASVPTYARYCTAAERRDIVVEVVYIVDAMEVRRGTDRVAGKDEPLIDLHFIWSWFPVESLQIHSASTPAQACRCRRRATRRRIAPASACPEKIHPMACSEAAYPLLRWRQFSFPRAAPRKPCLAPQRRPKASGNAMDRLRAASAPPTGSGPRAGRPDPSTAAP